MNNEIIIQDYINGGSLKELSIKNKCSTAVIKNILINNNIKIRSAGEQTAIRNSRNKISVNDNYFSKLNLENSYYLGFLAADGTVRKNKNEIKISLNKQDEDFLTELKNNIQYKGELHYYEPQNSVELRFSSFQMKKDLEKYSIVPRKTYIGVTMKNIPDEYKLAFIKGFFDGDGSFSINTSTKQCAVKIVSYTKDILQEIQNFIPQKTHLYLSKRNLYSLEFSTLEALDFLKNLYNLDTPKLQRKYDKYLEAIKLRIQ